MTKLQRQTVVKWLTLGMGLAIFFIQIFRYAFNKLSDFWTEFWFASLWAFLIIAPFTIPVIIKMIINKYFNKN